MSKHCRVCHIPLKRVGVKFVHFDGTPRCDGSWQATVLNEVVPKFQRREAELHAWLLERHPLVFIEQKHLDEGSPERAYWHCGYRSALSDALALVDKLRKEKP